MRTIHWALVGALAPALALGASCSADDASATGGMDDAADSDSGADGMSGPGEGEGGPNMSTTGPGGESGDGVNFITPPDGGVAGQCDPKAQDCPEGEKCSAYSTIEGDPWNANRCVEVAGTGQVGDPCDVQGGKYTGMDNCDIGFICLQTDSEGNDGVCTEFCNASDQCPESGAQCATYNDGSLPICLLTCDPLVQDCPTGQGCYASGSADEFVCFVHSGENGEGAPGDECNFINQCQPGTACLSPDAVTGCGAASGCCSPFCDLDAADPTADCNMGEACEPWFENPPPGLMAVGVCAIPA